MHIRDRVMMSHDACTSRMSWVLKVASLLRLKMEALIPAPADCEVWSVIKFLSTQSMARIKIHHQLYQVYGRNIMSKQMVHHWCRQQIDNMCRMRSTVGGHASLWTTLWSLCGNALWRIITSQYRTQQSFHGPCCIKLSWSTCSENCSPGGCQNNWHQNAKHMETALMFLQWYHDDGNKFLDQIITGDVTWVAHITLETMHQSMH